MVDLIPPFHNTLKKAKIEPLILPQEQLDELKSTFADPKSPELRKNIVMRQISGSCCIDGKIPTKIVKYRKYGVIIVEKYCDECLARMKI